LPSGVTTASPPNAAGALAAACLGAYQYYQDVGSSQTSRQERHFRGLPYFSAHVAFLFHPGVVYCVHYRAFSVTPLIHMPASATYALLSCGPTTAIYCAGGSRSAIDSISFVVALHCRQFVRWRLQVTCPADGILPTARYRAYRRLYFQPCRSGGHSTAVPNMVVTTTWPASTILPA